MSVLWLFDTCGYVFGPAIMVACLAALAMCMWASLRSGSTRLRRVTFFAAFAPVLRGLLGAFFGLTVCWSVGAENAPWWALGKVCLAGFVSTLAPLVWSTLLLWSTSTRESVR